MNLQIGDSPSPTFQQPLALLSDCHRRVERFLAVLVRIASEGGGVPLDPRQREALGAALRYFREAAPRHTADEEESLFPRLRATGSAVAADVLNRVAALERDHAEAEPHHLEVERLGTHWLSTGVLSESDRQSLAFHLKQLSRLYSAHIEIEDHVVFPAAARLLNADTLAEVGREMAQRRGQPFIPAGFPAGGRIGHTLLEHASS